MEVDEDVVSLETSAMSQLTDESGDEAETTAIEPDWCSVAKWQFTPADTALLARLVKMCQKKGYAGKSGDWKDYLKNIDAVAGADPARHPWNVLADFLDSLTEPHARQEMHKLVAWQRRLEEEEEMETTAMLMGAAAPLEGSLWQLVQRTQAHHRFAELYTLPAFNEGWQRKRHMPTWEQEPKLYAIDCEMCATASDDKALLSLCLVDMDGNVALRELVKPDEEVVDYRTAVTGHTADDLQNVRYTRDDAQRDVLGLLTEGVVLVGHALHHDLRALRLDFQPVIDTSLLLRYQDLPDSTPALSDMVGQLLGRQLRQPDAPHNVTADACAAMDLALYEHQKGPTLPLPAPEVKVPADDLRRLLVHSLAPGMRDVDIIYLFPTGCPAISEISRETPQARKAVVSFNSAADAATAFQMLEGKDGADSVGRRQKVLRVPDGQFAGTNVRVRVLHNIVMEKTTAAALPLPASSGSKRKR